MTYSSTDETETSDEELYVVAVLLLFFCVIGTAGNALVLYVFSNKKDGLVSTLFIMVLAVVDFMTCLVVVPFTVAMELVHWNVSSDLVCKFYQFLITSNIPFSSMIMAAIGVDRYLCICHPFRRILTLDRARLTVVVLGIFAAAMGLGGSLSHGIYSRRFYVNETSLAEAIANRSLVSGDDLSKLNNYPDDHPGNVAGEWITEYTGQCNPTYVLLSEQFVMAFQKCYSGIFLVCLGIVSVLYALIYYSVHQRRTKRQQQKVRESRVRPTATTAVSTAAPARDRSSPAAELTERNKHVADNKTELTNIRMTVVVEHDETHKDNLGLNDAAQEKDKTGESATVDANNPPPQPVNGTAADAAKSSCRHSHESSLRSSQKAGESKHMLSHEGTSSSTAHDNTLAAQARRNRIANVKTAAMLFVVTLTFVVSFVPALSMAVQLLPYEMTVFYMYFANNVANPIIYSFMNKNFRKHLKGIFC